MRHSRTAVFNGLSIIGLHLLLLPRIGALRRDHRRQHSQQRAHDGDGGGRAWREVVDLSSETVEVRAAEGDTGGQQHDQTWAAELLLAV